MTSVLWRCVKGSMELEATSWQDVVTDQRFVQEVIIISILLSPSIQY